MLWLVLLSTCRTGYLKVQRLRLSKLRMAVVVDNTIVYINNCPTTCNKEVYLLFCKFTLHVSGVNHTHHQELHKKYDQYRRLYLQFYVLLMLGVVDTRNVYSELAE